MDGAAANGHFAVLLFLHFARREGCSHATAVAASQGEHLEILQFAKRNKRPTDWTVCDFNVITAENRRIESSGRNSVPVDGVHQGPLSNSPSRTQSPPFNMSGHETAVVVAKVLTIITTIMLRISLMPDFNRWRKNRNTGDMSVMPCVLL
ncbi:hypothetical protein PF001_g33358, partial [Phytophthora fragariae]